MGKSKHHSQPIPRDRTSNRSGAWDALSKLYDSLKDYATLPTSLSPMLRNKEAVSQIEDKQLLVSRSNTLAADCQKMAAELIEIESKHHGRFGEPKNDNDHMFCLDVHSRYMDWAERFETVVYPTYTAILQQFSSTTSEPEVKAMAADLSEIRFFQKETPTETDTVTDAASVTDSKDTPAHD